MSAAYYPGVNLNTGNSQPYVASVQYIGLSQQPGVVLPAAGQQSMAQPGINSNTGNSQPYVASVQYIGLSQQPGVVQPAADQQYIAQPGQQVQMVYTPNNYTAMAGQQQPAIIGDGAVGNEFVMRCQQLSGVAICIFMLIVMLVIWQTVF
eukprot:gene26707-32273_t